jgi:hypothetical protein
VSAVAWVGGVGAVPACMGGGLLGMVRSGHALRQGPAGAAQAHDTVGCVYVWAAWRVFECRQSVFAGDKRELPTGVVIEGKAKRYKAEDGPEATQQYTAMQVRRPQRRPNGVQCRQVDFAGIGAAAPHARSRRPFHRSR